MSWPASGSSGFARLHPHVQRWVYDHRWPALRPIQEAAIEPILAGRDVLLSAATAGGKTEAAFFPIVTALADEAGGGVRALDVSPLKALINDQFERLTDLCRGLDLPVARWHGDVDQGAKRRLLRDPAGILLITPESLEAFHVLRGSRLRHLFGGLQFVVVDEVHAFLGTERGRQLQSLLHRVEQAAGHTIPRIGLSATLGDLDLAAAFLRPDAPGDVVRIEDRSFRPELKLAVRGYRSDGSDDDEEPSGEQQAIAEHLFRVLRGSKSLVFPNTRRLVERYTDLLRGLCEQHRLPPEFEAHHGSLDKGLRLEVEERLRDGTRPLTVVCTNTLELGIDVGSIGSIAQIGPPPSVASLRQRLGRSGRLPGQAQVLRIYVPERDLDAESQADDLLRPDLFETVAMVELLLAGWTEPPDPARPHLSTLVQQLLSLVAERGGIGPGEAWQLLCRTGPFRAVDASRFQQFLRCLGAAQLLEQDPAGQLLLAEKGERLVGHFSFYAAFETPEEYRLVHGSRTLGTLPIEFPLMVGGHLVFGGRRWRILMVDQDHRVVELEPSSSGTAPQFSGGSGWIHDRVRQEMRRVYQDCAVPVYLDSTARGLLEEGRQWFDRFHLSETWFAAAGADTLLCPFSGDRIQNTLGVLLQAAGMGVVWLRSGLLVQGVGPYELEPLFAAWARSEPPDGLALAATVANKLSEKHHLWLDEELLCLDYAASRLDLDGTWRRLREAFGG